MVRADEARQIVEVWNSDNPSYYTPLEWVEEAELAFRRFQSAMIAFDMTAQLFWLDRHHTMCRRIPDGLLMQLLEDDDG